MKENSGQTHLLQKESGQFPKTSVTISLGEVSRASIVLSIKTSIWGTELNVDNNIVFPQFVVRMIK